MKVALIYDRVNKWGGAERVLLALHKIWPDAPLYTAVYNSVKASWASVFQIHPSFIQHLPLAISFHELYPWLMPLGFETFNFDDYDVVISVTSAEAKNIITKPGTLHICYCLTPTRYLWSGVSDYSSAPHLNIIDKVSRIIYAKSLSTLRSWDKIAASRPDYYIAISERVKRRIEEYYNRHVETVIYPPLATSFSDKIKPQKGEYFLVVSRLVGYKKIDKIIQAFNHLNLPLVVVGSGLALDYLKSMAQKNIRFVSNYLTEEELVLYYEGCRALVIAAEEDFGLTAIEAQARGKPVIAYRESAVAETVVDGKTGILFQEQTPQSIIDAVNKFERIEFRPGDCQKNISQFSEENFLVEMRKTVESLYNQNKL